MLDWISAQHKSPLDLSRETIIVTGGNRGLGRGIAGHLASFGARLILPCRRCPDDLADQVLKDAKEYRTLYGGNEASVKKVNVEVYQGFDLADMDSIDKFVAYCKKNNIRATIFISNAGLVDSEASRTKHNFEYSFGVNFFGNAYLTHSLWTTGVLAPDARVVSVTSEDHRGGSTVKEIMNETGKPFGYFWGKGIVDTIDRYMYSKLAQTTWFLTLAKKSKLHVSDVCPGPVGSEISMTAPWPLNVIVTPILGLLFPTIARAAVPIVRLAVSPEYQSLSGIHYHLGEERPARGDARDPEIQEQVWNWTLDLFNKRQAPT